ncbi:AraC family transcriptional regulator [Bordetella sp. N]|uniref:AraC family transcriptional regulator n=1 Tax=Bordetella sp. N TaxID=1746199 RepID=UPI000AD70B25|nr:AraC family transcriptional regulator [Bordetella sp. N]
MDWLSHLLDVTPVSGQVDVRCHFGAPWRIDQAQAGAGEIPYHVLLSGTAILDQGDAAPLRLQAGDVLLFPQGAGHTLHDGSGARSRTIRSHAAGPLVIKQTVGKASAGPRTAAGTPAGADDLDLLCGRFLVHPRQGRLLRDYLPAQLVIRPLAVVDQIAPADGLSAAAVAERRLRELLLLMRNEANGVGLGGRALLNALSAALFALVLRHASLAEAAPAGLLALAGEPRLAPALDAMFQEASHPWTLEDLAERCNMSRATFVRHFQARTGRPAIALLTDIRMALALDHLKRTTMSTGAVAEAVGYQSEAAFQRAFKQHVGQTPAAWRAATRSGTP